MAAQEPVRRPYLEGNYAPVSTETEARGLTSRGAIPRDLAALWNGIAKRPDFTDVADEQSGESELYILDAAHADELAQQRPMDRLS